MSQSAEGRPVAVVGANPLEAQQIANITLLDLGICCGHFDDNNSHPHRDVLRLLDQNRERLRWVRTPISSGTASEFVMRVPANATRVSVEVELTPACPNHLLQGANNE